MAASGRLPPADRSSAGIRFRRSAEAKLPELVLRVMPLSGPWAPRIHFGAARVGILEFACDDDWQAHFVGAMLCRIFRWNWLGALMHLVFALAGALLLSLICESRGKRSIRFPRRPRPPLIF